MINMKDALKALQKIKTEVEISESQFSLVNDAAGVASLVVTQTGRLCEVNYMAAQLLGYLPQEMEGRFMGQMLDASSGDVFAEGALLEWLDRPIAPRTFAMRGKSGRSSPIQMVAHKLQTREGEPSDRMVLIWSEPERVIDKTQRALHTQTELQQLTDKLLAAQETERKRLAKELHDGMSQALTMIKFSLEEASRSLEEKHDAHAQEKLKSSIDLVREALGDARRIAHELWPSSLDNLGLLPTVKGFCRQFMDTQPQIKVIADLFVREEDVPDNLRVDVFRVLQECLRNVAQHAKAREVRVILRVTSEGLLLTVKDDGEGFDAERLFYGQTCLLGIGLRSMRERLEMHRGELQVQSRQGDGTTILALWRLHAPYTAEVLASVREDLPTLSRLSPRGLAGVAINSAQIRVKTIDIGSSKFGSGSTY
jgi:two-component system NarL family sensor kinase